MMETLTVLFGKFVTYLTIYMELGDGFYLMWAISYFYQFSLYCAAVFLAPLVFGFAVFKYTKLVALFALLICVVVSVLWSGTITYQIHKSKLARQTLRGEKFI